MIRPSHTWHAYACCVALTVGVAFRRLVHVVVRNGAAGEVDGARIQVGSVVHVGRKHAARAPAVVAAALHHL